MHSGGWAPTRGRNPTGYNSSSTTPNPNTHTTFNITYLPPMQRRDNDGDLDDEESSIYRKIKIYLNEIDIPDWTSIVFMFNRLRRNRMLNSISI
jgi:hypothetical protein